MDAPAPYMGKENYIFISYSHRDTAQVYPIITELSNRGYRVWYDSGIDPGTEWDENIAQHINECGYFIGFLSKNYLASNNCKDELNYARDLEKERLLVYLEDVQLPPGMAMRVNRLQSIFKYGYPTDEAFYEKLCSAKSIDTCHPDGKAPVTASAPRPAAPVQPHYQAPAYTPPQPSASFVPPRQTQPNQQIRPQPTAQKQTGQPVRPQPRQTAYRPPVQPQQRPPQPGQPMYQAPYGQPQPGYAPYDRPVPVKSKTAAGFFALFLGVWGGHKFYLGKIGLGFAYIGIWLFCLIFGAGLADDNTGLGVLVLFIPSILALIDAVVLFTSSKQRLEPIYRCRFM